MFTNEDEERTIEDVCLGFVVDRRRCALNFPECLGLEALLLTCPHKISFIIRVEGQ